MLIVQSGHARRADAGSASLARRLLRVRVGACSFCSVRRCDEALRLCASRNATMHDAH